MPQPSHSPHRQCALTLGHSVSAHCLCHRAHTRLNDALCSTSMDHLLILLGIQPVEIRRQGATLSLAYREFLDPDHILYVLLIGSSDARQERLRSSHLFVPAARNLLNNIAGLSICTSQWTIYSWNTEYCEYMQASCFYIQGQCQACWDKLASNSLGQNQLVAD